jgi:hypothetical protein
MVVVVVVVSDLLVHYHSQSHHSCRVCRHRSLRHCHPSSPPCGHTPANTAPYHPATCTGTRAEVTWMKMCTCWVLLHSNRFCPPWPKKCV